jgi:hypothetical protein
LNAAFREADVGHEQRRTTFLDQLDRLGASFRLSEDTKVMEAKKPSQEDARLFVTGDDYCRGVRQCVGIRHEDRGGFAKDPEARPPV